MILLEEGGGEGEGCRGKIEGEGRGENDFFVFFSWLISGKNVAFPYILFKTFGVLFYFLPALIVQIYFSTFFPLHDIIW